MDVGDKEDAKEEDVAMTDDGTKDSSLTKEEVGIISICVFTIMSFSLVCLLLSLSQ